MWERRKIVSHVNHFEKLLHDPTSFISKLFLFLSLPLCRPKSFLTDRGGREGGRIQINYSTARKPGHL